MAICAVDMPGISTVSCSVFRAAVCAVDKAATWAVVRARTCAVVNAWMSSDPNTLIWAVVSAAKSCVSIATI